MIDKPAEATPMDWGLGHYERTAEKLLPAAKVLVTTAAVRQVSVSSTLERHWQFPLLAAAAGAHVPAGDPTPRLLALASAAAHREGAATSPRAHLDSERGSTSRYVVIRCSRGSSHR